MANAASVTASSTTWAGAGCEVPEYLERVYWWAYVHPRAVRLFEREWLVNGILWGNYARLRDAALEAMLDAPHRRNLQLACVYGDLTERLAGGLGADAHLDVVDVLPVQLRNLRAKLGASERVGLICADASALRCADASYDQVLVFFLLHEQPAAVRRATLAEALRVVRPGGRVVVIDYHRPHALHPLRPLMHAVLATLEPFALDLWRHDIAAWLPGDRRARVVDARRYFGGLYQRLIIERDTGCDRRAA